MLRRTLTALCVAAPLVGAQGPPGTDIFVAALRDSAGALVLGPVRNVTARAGYDNQPYWSARGDVLYHSALLPAGQTDIWRIVLATGAKENVTASPESEYSPTLMPAGNALSVIRVERDSSQRLWRIPLASGSPSVIVPDIKPVGYHAWANDTTLALFVLGSPATLQIANARTGVSRVAARDIQRGVNRVPGNGAISYVQRVSREESWVMRFDVATGDTTRIAPLPTGVQDHAWTPGGVLLCARNAEVLAWRAGTGWTVIADLQSQGVSGLTRLAVSPRGDAIALVGQDRVP